MVVGNGSVEMVETKERVCILSPNSLSSLLRWVKAGFYCRQALFRLLTTESLWCILHRRSTLVVFVLYPVIVLWLMM